MLPHSWVSSTQLSQILSLTILTPNCFIPVSGVLCFWKNESVPFFGYERIQVFQQMLLNNLTICWIVQHFKSWFFLPSGWIRLWIYQGIEIKETANHSPFLIVQDINFVWHGEMGGFYIHPSRMACFLLIKSTKGWFIKRKEEKIIMYIICNVTFMDKIRHVLNPLHIYCRLTYIGVSQKVALGICKSYEACVYRRTIGRPC